MTRHREVIYGCGCVGIDSRSDAEWIDCPRCTGMAWMPSRPVLSYEERLAMIDRSAMPYGDREQRERFERHLQGAKQWSTEVK